MSSRVCRVSIVSLQLAALLLFSSSAPLTHLHQESRASSHAHDGLDHEPASPASITFHFHLDGHPHDADTGRSHEPGQQRDDSLVVSHGKVDSPRVERPAKPLLALGPNVELIPPPGPIAVVADTPSDVYRPPPLLFPKPVRAPPGLA